MSDNEKESSEERSLHGNDWEFVSLTSSVYTATPGPHKILEPTPDPKKDDNSYKFESPSDLFMSHHFLLPEEKPKSNSQKPKSNSQMNETTTSSPDKNGVEKSSNLEVKQNEESEEDFQAGPARDKTEDREEESVGPMSRREGWWRKQVLSFYNSNNTLWSVFVGAVLVGVVIVGQRWQREKLHLQQLKLNFNITNERVSCTVGPTSQFKGVFVAGNTHSSFATIG